MQYKVNDFRWLKCYKATLNLYERIIEENEYMYEDAMNIRYGLVKAISYLAKSTGDILYVKASLYDLKKAIEWNDYSLKYLNDKDRNELIRIKRMVLGLKKKVEGNNYENNY